MSDQTPGYNAGNVQDLRAEEAAREESIRQQYLTLILVTRLREYAFYWECMRCDQEAEQATDTTEKLRLKVQAKAFSAQLKIVAIQVTQYESRLANYEHEMANQDYLDALD